MATSVIATPYVPAASGSKHFGSPVSESSLVLRTAQWRPTGRHRTLSKLLRWRSRFLHINMLEVHKQSHSGEALVLLCHFCLREQPDAAALQAHQAEHTGAKPYLCTICGKTYKKRETMEESLERTVESEESPSMLLNIVPLNEQQADHSEVLISEPGHEMQWASVAEPTRPASQPNDVLERGTQRWEIIKLLLLLWEGREGVSDFY